MRMIEPHLHVETLTADNMMHMAMTGITDLIGHVWYPPFGTNITNETLKYFYEKLIGFEPWRSEQYMLKTYLSIGINPWSVPDKPDKLLDQLHEYFKNKIVVGVGEIGFEPASPTCKDEGLQEHIFRRQLKIAKDEGVPAACHTPGKDKEPDKLYYTKKILDIVEDSGFPMEKTIIEHVSASTIEEVLSRGAWAGIAVQPWREIYPIDAARLVLKYGIDKVLISGDINVLPSDPLSVPKTRFYLKAEGFTDEQLDQLFVKNILKCYSKIDG